MILFPKAKINLGLHVVSKREDGFHSIESVFYPIDLTDILEVIPSANPGIDLEISGMIPDGDPDTNLVSKAYYAVEAIHRIPGVKVHLHKHIPMGAGLGGGSSDAASMVKALNILFNLKMSDNDMRHIVASLGSDCAFFVASQAAFASGRGEILEPISLDLSDYEIGLIHPNVHVSTKEAYAGIVPKSASIHLKTLSELPVREWRDKVKNDFEETVFRKFPVVAEAKQRLYDLGAIYAGMSGSGSTCFGLFEREAENVLKYIWV
jgi:4-diphosphocytidyl-2-C-methyl-D-erythritol kinase